MLGPARPAGGELQQCAHTVLVHASLHSQSSASSHGNGLRAEEMRDRQVVAAQGCPHGPECSGVQTGIPSPILPEGTPHPAVMVPSEGMGQQGCPRWP